MASNNGTATNPPSSQQPSSTPVSIASSQPPSSQAPSSTPQPSSAPATSVVIASSAPPSTQFITSVVTPSATSPGETPTPSIIVVTSVISQSAGHTSGSPTSTGTQSSSSTSPATLQNDGSKGQNKGLTSGGKTAIAVVIPVVAVALLVVAGIFLWKKRKQRKNAEEARRKEVEEYGFNPNNDPTLPAVGMAGSEMAEDQSGYRGWGNTSSTNRKASTTLTSGMTGGGYSDNGSNPGGYQSPGSPTQISEGHSTDPLMNGRRETMDSEGIGALGAAPAANHNRGDIHRGPSNASSSYSAANRSDNSGEYPIPANNPQEYYSDNNYYQSSPYGDGGYGGQPIIRDVSARRNTRIENPSVFPQQGNSGIAQNF